MFKRVIGLILLGALAVSLSALAEEGDVFYGRGPFKILIPWGGGGVVYPAYSHSDGSLLFLAVGIGGGREVFGALIRGFDFADAFEDWDDRDLVRSLFSLSRNDHIETMGSDYSAVFSGEATIGGCYAVKEEFEEETPSGLKMRGYCAVFGDRHLCYWIHISCGEADFPHARARIDAIIDGIATGGAYPAFVEALPLSIALDDEEIPLMLVGVSEEDPVSALLQWEDTGISIRMTVALAESDADASALADVLADEMTRVVGDGADWSGSSREIYDFSVELYRAETSDDDGDWIQTVFAWSSGSTVYAGLYKRFDFEYDDRDIKRIVYAFLPDD